MDEQELKAMVSERMKQVGFMDKMHDRLEGREPVIEYPDDVVKEDFEPGGRFYNAVRAAQPRQGQVQGFIPQTATPPTASSYTHLQKLEGWAMRSKFAAAGWLAGASWQQLGILFGVNKSSIRVSALKAFRGLGRIERLSTASVTFTTMSEWWERYKTDLQWRDIEVLALGREMLFAPRVEESD